MREGGRAGMRNERTKEEAKEGMRKGGGKCKRNEGGRE